MVDQISPDSTAEELDLFTSLGYLESSGMSGSAFTLGVRYGVGKHFAVSFDASGSSAGAGISKWMLAFGDATSISGRCVSANES